MKAYILQPACMPWGDYGEILLGGMVGHLDREDGLLQLERTGPFVPPIAVECEIVVTDAFKVALQASGLSGVAFRPIIKRHIVQLDRRTWDLTAANPAEYPAGFEPEEYILDRVHDPVLAAQMGPLWEVALEEHASTGREQRGPGRWDQEMYLVGESWDGTDWFRAADVGFKYVSETAKGWLETNAPEWVSFGEVSLR